MRGRAAVRIAFQGRGEGLYLEIDIRNTFIREDNKRRSQNNLLVLQGLTERTNVVSRLKA